MVSNQESIVDRVRSNLQQSAALHESVGKRQSIERFVLDHGREFATTAPRRRFISWVRRANACFTNCLQLAIIERLVYVEGFAVLPAAGFEFHHAWCLDEAGRVLDPTWEAPGSAYFGVPFDLAYVVARYQGQAEFGETGSLLAVGDDGFALVTGAEVRPWRMSDRVAPMTGRST